MIILKTQKQSAPRPHYSGGNMFIFKKSTISLVAFLTINAFQCYGGVDMSYNIASDTPFRGLTQNDHKPTTTGNLDYNTDLIKEKFSFNLGTCITNVPDTSGKIEEDFYGWATYKVNDLSLTLGGTRYTFLYAGSTNTTEY